MGSQAQREFNADAAIAQFSIVEDAAVLAICQSWTIFLRWSRDILLPDAARRRRRPDPSCVDEIDLAFALLRFAVAQYPDVSSDACFVCSGSEMTAASQSFSNIRRQLSRSPLPASPVKRGEAFAMRLPFCQYVLQEDLGDARVAGTEADIVAERFVLAADDVLDSLPFHAAQRAGEYEAEALAGMPIFAADWIAAALAMA